MDVSELMRLATLHGRIVQLRKDIKDNEGRIAEYMELGRQLEDMLDTLERDYWGTK